MAKAGFVVALAALVVYGCAGTERPIFESVVGSADVPPDVSPPAMRPDAGPPKVEPPPPPPVSIPVDDEDGGAHPDPGLDPTAEFPWTQTLPGAGTCKSGRYAGAFDCIMIGGVTGWPLLVTGELAFTLRGSPEQQVLTVEDASLEGPFFSAETIMGSLNCTSDRFSAYSLDGAVASGIFPGAFSTFLSGTFDDQALAIEGALSMVNDSGEQCEGMFNVSIAP